ncbi:MAG: hypothetical protein IT435_04095 [Phycisphaerales bacterium]|nr:hypothetical protein [Phycisphaerales bacterium]
MNDGQRERLYERLRWPGVTGTVPGSLPVLFFGDLPNATVATIGINPSRQEYLTPKGVELDGPARRFETLRSLGASDRASLSADQCDRAVATMRGYFGPQKPVYSWFRPLARVVDGFGASLQAGTCAHLDLVQEATDPVWSGLHGADPASAEAVLARDLQFLRWQVESFPLRAVICTSAAVLRNVMPLVGGQVVTQGELGRVRWLVARGHAAGRPLSIAGWNIPLVRPTGLDAAAQVGLGELLHSHVGHS